MGACLGDVALAADTQVIVHPVVPDALGLLLCQLVLAGIREVHLHRMDVRTSAKLHTCSRASHCYLQKALLVLLNDWRRAVDGAHRV